jgi:ubiquinone/menaquinone biosynthesis C-methylase UbiE
MNTLPLQRFVEPETVVSHFHLREGDVVADFGAGSGYYIEPIARAIGQGGRLYACDIQKDLIDKITDLARKKGLGWVHPLWCDLEEAGGVKIPDESVDCGIIINTLFQLENRRAALLEISRVIRRGGKLIIVDWSESFGGLGPAENDVLTEQDARSLCENFGFVYERSFDAGDHHYGVALRKA